MKENLAVKIVAGYVAIGFVTMEILYLGVWCRPFYKYWAVPTDNSKCRMISFVAWPYPSSVLLPQAQFCHSFGWVSLYLYSLPHSPSLPYSTLS